MVEKITFDSLPSAMAEVLERVSRMEALLEKQFSAPASTKAEDSPNYRFCMKELQDYLPDHPAAPTVYGWVRNNLIPYYKVGKKLFFKKGEIDAWLDAGRNKTDEELASEAIDYINGRRTR